VDRSIDAEEHPWSGLRVAYQGVPGAYSEQAAESAYTGCVPVPCAQFEDAFASVEQWRAERAVLPVENSLGGSIHRNYDLLLRHRLHVVGELNFPVSHCLMVLPGVKVQDIKRVISHPQALAQCDGYLSALPGAPRKEAVDDTAGAAKSIVDNGWGDVAAVASSRAAELYGMDVLGEGIQDDTNNITRFIAVSRDPIVPQPGVPFKTSIVFTLQEGSGVLFRALSCFALRDIDLTKIESRPLRSNPIAVADGALNMRFKYLFYVDFVSSMAEEDAQNALRHLGEMATYLRVLGSYPMDTSSR